MPFRNPLYLDADLLANLADYYGIGTPEEMNVTRRSSKEGSRGGGINKVVVATGERSHAEEVTESYSVLTRPVRILNDLLDHIESTGDIVDLDADPEAPVSNSAVVLLRGDLSPSAANEVGGVMARLMPLLMTSFSKGQTDFEPSQAEIAAAFMTESAPDTPQLFDIAEDSPVEGRRSLLVVEPQGLRGTSTFDDLEGDQTVVAHVDRIVRPRNEFSLDKYVLPGLPRAVRRLVGRKELASMLDGFDELVGRKIDPDELTLRGPALLLKPLAIF
jgi:hypothetical protein